MKFHAGDAVMHWMHGFGTVIRLEKRSLIPGEKNALFGATHFADWLSRTAPER